MKRRKLRHARPGVARAQSRQTLPALVAYQAFLEANPFAARCADSYEAGGLVEPFSVSQSPWWRRLLRFLAQPCGSGTNGCWCRR